MADELPVPVSEEVVYAEDEEAFYEEEDYGDYEEEKPKRRGLFRRRKRDSEADEREIAASYPTEEHPAPPPPGMTDEQDLVPPPPAPATGETQEHDLFTDQTPSEVYEDPEGSYGSASDQLGTIAPDTGEGPAPFDFEESPTGEGVVYEETYIEEEVVVYEEPGVPAEEPASAADQRDVLAEEEEEFADEVAEAGASADDDDLWFEQKPPEDFDFDEEGTTGK